MSEETKLDGWGIATRLTWIIALIVIFILTFNPFGISQRLFWGMQPPYHWVPTHNVIDERHLTGANGRICATLYEFEGQWKVYGFGFSDDSASMEDMQYKAERNCR